MLCKLPANYAWDVLLGDAYGRSTASPAEQQRSHGIIIIHEPCQHRGSTWATATPAGEHRLNLGEAERPVLHVQDAREVTRRRVRQVIHAIIAISATVHVFASQEVLLSVKMLRL